MGKFIFGAVATIGLLLIVFVLGNAAGYAAGKADGESCKPSPTVTVTATPKG
jgi:hypothetical protein